LSGKLGKKTYENDAGGWGGSCVVLAITFILRGQVAVTGEFPPDFGEDDGGTDSNSSFSSNLQPQLFTTNDLWLQIIQMSNATAGLVINSPWNVTDGVYDLFAHDPSCAKRLAMGDRVARRGRPI